VCDLGKNLVNEEAKTHWGLSREERGEREKERERENRP
jgi:hypothetical protein